MLSFINKYTCTPNQLFKISNKIKSKKMVPIIDYVNENKSKDYRNYLEIKDKIIKYDNNYFALKLSSFNINYNKKMAMTKANILIYEAIQKKSKILIDAEQHAIQHKIDYVTDCCMIKYNKDDVNVYKTYQMYKKKSLDKFKSDLKDPRKYYIGFKLVRGAYLNEDKRKGVLCDSYEEVNENYNEAILEFMKHSKSKDRLMCATHNYKSICKAKEWMDIYKKENVEFAQLMGMSDDISKELVKNNYKVLKYIPYGEFYESIPYLIRRLYENYPMMKYFVF